LDNQYRFFCVYFLCNFI